VFAVPQGTVEPRLGSAVLKHTGYVMHQQFNIQQLYALPTLYLRVYRMRHGYVSSESEILADSRLETP
jgi:hypothetical protein